MPWKLRPRTRRDTLIEIALDMTECMKFNILEARLILWHQEWLQQCYPGSLVCSRGCQKHCFCSFPPSSIPSDETTLLQGEFWAIALLLLLRQRNALIADVDDHEHLPSTDIQEINAACQYIYADLASVLASPCFGQVSVGDSNSSGISEGRSRFLFCSSVLDLYREPFSEDVFWEKCAGRLNGASS